MHTRQAVPTDTLTSTIPSYCGGTVSHPELPKVISWIRKQEPSSYLPFPISHSEGSKALHDPQPSESSPPSWSPLRTMLQTKWQALAPGRTSTGKPLLLTLATVIKAIPQNVSAPIWTWMFFPMSKQQVRTAETCMLNGQSPGCLSLRKV